MHELIFKLLIGWLAERQSGKNTWPQVGATKPSLDLSGKFLFPIKKILENFMSNKL